MKPGYRTTEFWFTLVSFIFSGLFLFGVITEPDTKDELISVVTHAVESVILIGGQCVVLSKYIKKRKEEHIEYEKTKQKEADLFSKELEDYVGVDKTHKHININTASVGELIQLPHIGPGIAQKIIEYRNNNKFKNIKDIKYINGIGNAIYKEIRNYIIV